MYVSVHVGMCVFADDPDSTDLRTVGGKNDKAACKEECENASAITV